MKISLRNILAYLVAKSLIMSGIAANAKAKALRGDHMLSFYFHNPSSAEFEFIIKWLKRNGFQIIDMESFLKIVSKEIPIPKGAILLTVDDGWADNLPNMVPIAEREKAPITIFIATEAVEKGNFWFSYSKLASKKRMGYPSTEKMKQLPNQERMKLVREIQQTVQLPREALTIEEIKEISKSRYVNLGVHTHTHPILIQCSDEELAEEIRVSKEKMEKWSGKKMLTFAYPNGDYGLREKAALKNEGFSLGFSIHTYVINEETLKQRYDIPRNGFLEGASKSENICRLLGIWQKATIKIFNK